VTAASVKSLDAVVVGVGAMGSAALYHLARRGANVAGFDAYTPPHAFGSSHGESRMIRESYYEDPRYVPLLRRAYTLWHELARDAGESLIEETGGVFAGLPDGQLIAGIERAGREHTIPIERFSNEACAARVPWLRLGRGMTALAERRAGLLRPERCIAAHLRLATEAGADIHTDEAVETWRADGDGFVVETQKGRYRTARLVLCAGAGMTDWLAAAGVAANVTRQTMFWLRPARDPEAFALGSFPVWAIQIDDQRLLYGFPDLGSGLKVAVHYGGVPTTWQTVDRTVTENDANEVEGLLDRFLPGVRGERLRAAVCIYTNTPDLHFVVDAHPAHSKVLLVSACSGHGFKFASAIGEAAAQWTLEGAPRLDLSLFSLERF
jgi:sarcosine oxidase